MAVDLWEKESPIIQPSNGAEISARNGTCLHCSNFRRFLETSWLLPPAVPCSNRRITGLLLRTVATTPIAWGSIMAVRAATTVSQIPTMCVQSVPYNH